MQDCDILHCTDRVSLNVTESVRSQGLEMKRNCGRLLDQIQVNAPYRKLVDQYLVLFLEHDINPEIGFDANSLDRINEESLTAMAHLLAERGRTITLHGPFMDLAPGGMDEQVRRVSALRLDRTLDLVPFFRARSIVFHAGYDDRRYKAHRQEWLSRSLATWGPIIRRAEEIGVVIHLENVYEQAPEMILSLIEAIDSENLGFCLDVGHMNAFGDAPLREWLDALGPHLREVHLHDNDGHNDLHGPLGSGTVPFEELFRHLSNASIKPVITLEPHEEKSFWQSLESLENLWPWEE